MGTAVKESKRLEQDRIKHYKFLITEYELVKSKQHKMYKKIGEFYKAHNLHRQTFLKYFHRFKQGGCDKALLPEKRGPKYKTRRPLPLIENKVLSLRESGCNKYEIAHTLKPILKKHAPSPSGVYKILKRHQVNRLTVKEKEVKRRIIKEKAGELAHVDAHYLPKGTVAGYDKPLYMIAIIDDCSRVAGCEVIRDLKSLTVMFAILRQLNIINDMYSIKFAEIMTDNGPEFGRSNSKVKDEHPFERMLIEMGIKHRYTRPYRPQTNGKVERFWRTLKEDMLEDTEYKTIQELENELCEYLVYYNYQRPHQGLNGETPIKFLESVDKIA